VSQLDLSPTTFLSGLSQVEREALFAVLPSVDIPAGEVLMREGESQGNMYLVVEGEVEIIKAQGTTDERKLGVRGAGDLLGEMSLLNPDHKHTASVRALGDVKALQMSRLQFETLIQQYPALMYSMLRQLSQRLSQSDNATIRDLREKNRQLTLAYEELQQAQVQLVEKERLEREMELARQIQRGILPASLPQEQGFDFGALMFPARAVGGDFYDLIDLGDHRLGIVLGDVSDKGVPSALIMSMTHTLVRVEAGQNLSPLQVVANVNQHLLRFCRARMFVTLLYGILDCTDGTFHYVRAGHPPPILCSSQAAGPRQLDFTQGQLLGMLDDPVFDEQQVLLSPGESLVIYSDGVTEAAKEQNQPLGEQGFLDCLATLPGVSAQATCDRIHERVMAYTGPVPQQDDITLICIQRK
jgi:sigma-B regulation protein RsbU (phosphoserine phosphatase)